MVIVFTRPVTLDITAMEEKEIYGLLSSAGGMTPEAVASEVRVDENEVEVYLANQTGLGNLQYAAGRYSTRR